MVRQLRGHAAPVTYLVFGLIDILVFGVHAHGSVAFSFTPEFAKVTVPNLSLPAAATCYFCGAVTLALAAARLLSVLGVVKLGRVPRRVIIGAVLFLFVIALLAWASGGQSIPFSVINLLSGTLSDSIPIMLGALTEGVRYFTAYIPSPKSRVRAFIDAQACVEQILALAS